MAATSMRGGGNACQDVSKGALFVTDLKQWDDGKWREGVNRCLEGTNKGAGEGVGHFGQDEGGVGAGTGAEFTAGLCKLLDSERWW